MHRMLVVVSVETLVIIDICPVVRKVMGSTLTLTDKLTEIILYAYNVGRHRTAWREIGGGGVRRLVIDTVAGNWNVGSAVSENNGIIYCQPNRTDTVIIYANHTTVKQTGQKR